MNPIVKTLTHRFYFLREPKNNYPLSNNLCANKSAQSFTCIISLDPSRKGDIVKIIFILILCYSCRRVMSRERHTLSRVTHYQSVAGLAV